jgi:isoamylase
MNYWTPDDGLPYPYGSSWNNDKQGFNFAIYSKEATALTLVFFRKDSPGQIVFEYRFDVVKNRTGSNWHCFIRESLLNGADSYGYLADGNNNKPSNHFDPEKLLSDPWGKAIYFTPAFSRTAAIAGGRNIDKAALSLLIKKDTNPDGFENDVKPKHFHDLVIYEMHVRGFTKHASSGIDDHKKGTFAGVIEKIPYLVELGVTAVELMPVFQFDPQEDNYWGYMTMNFFSPHQLFGSTSDSWDLVKEFKSMVLALHQAGIEVILDVIYNHTVEGGHDGPNYSFKGLDNSSYYLLTPDMKNYINDAGTGNVMRTSYKMVRKLILDSLRYWVQEMHVDGFRFDLAAIFTRNDDGSVNLINPPLLEEISMDPILADTRLIAEPWDIASYQLGSRFPGANWAQWNGAYRDDARKFIKGDNDSVAKMMTRIYGSPDLFPPGVPASDKPWQSINFITSHDGFSLYDLVAYDEKHNDSNGYNNTDGSNDNYSWNCGWEGDRNVPDEIVLLRKRQAKNFITLLMFSNGIPMFRMGDEFLLTQNGNNNPFNQDNATSWIDWNRLHSFSDIHRFFKIIIACRKKHPSLCRGNFWGNDIEWYGVNGQTDISYFSHTLAYHLKGSSCNDDDFYVMINSYWQQLHFTVHVDNIQEWKMIIDTSLNSPNDITAFSDAMFLTNTVFTVKGRSIVVLQKWKDLG